MRKIIKGVAALTLGLFALASCGKKEEANKDLNKNEVPFGSSIEYVIKNDGTFETTESNYLTEISLKKKSIDVSIKRLTTITLSDKNKIYYYECGNALQAQTLLDNKKEIYLDSFTGQRDANILTFYSSKESYDEYVKNSAKDNSVIGKDLTDLAFCTKVFKTKKNKLARCFNNDDVINCYDVSGSGNIFEFESSEKAVQFKNKWDEFAYKDYKMDKVDAKGNPILDKNGKTQKEVVYTFKQLVVKENYVYDLGSVLLDKLTK